MRHRYLVTYDVSDAKRLRRLFKTLGGFGEHLQYSVFQCDLSDVERIELKGAIWRIINHAEDRILVVDIGPVEGRASVAFECLGVQTAPTDRGPVIV